MSLEDEILKTQQMLQPLIDRPQLKEKVSVSNPVDASILRHAVAREANISLPSRYCQAQSLIIPLQ